MKWWGWGDPDHRVEIPEQALRQLKELLGRDLALKPLPSLDSLNLPASKLSSSQIAAFEGALGSDHVKVDDNSRVLHTAGKSYPDLVKMRSGTLEPAPDAVLYPHSEDSLSEVIRLCDKEEIAVVPFGGGTSVVGGVEPLRGRFKSVISLDLGSMSSLLKVDKQSLTATFEPGLRGPQVEAQLSKHGLTLGHFPQSYEYSTIGGWVVTRSAGQASSGYGRIDDLVVSLDCACPVGRAEVGAFPATAAGPSLKELFVGSEGSFGVVSRVTVKVRPAPKHRRFEAWIAKSFLAGAEMLRELEQSGLTPDVARLSDQTETAISLLMAAGSGLKERIGRSYLKARGYGEGALIIFGFEGEEDRIQARRLAASEVARKHSCAYLGTGAGRAWNKGRFEGPYLRDSLIDYGVMAETLETATEWSRLEKLYSAVQRALTQSLDQSGGGSIVMCHISHLYPDGASLYFTFLSPQSEDDYLGQWSAAKRAASDAIVAGGGTITHHHAVGHDHRPWITAEVGQIGVGILRSAKEYLDPKGIMNPGKLLPD